MVGWAGTANAVSGGTWRSAASRAPERQHDGEQRRQRTRRSETHDAVGWLAAAHFADRGRTGSHHRLEGVQTRAIGTALPHWAWPQHAEEADQVLATPRPVSSPIHRSCDRRRGTGAAARQAPDAPA